ncbi:hypothetical protein BKA62DRAFT_829487 [Auriculariales sp. MPI-PUGE-AT-0066]|nr:hypothetical protein BKA62DRAFT_829487 [Auriculariales sp. MPI-PUGE-AT-0066]
MAAPYRTWPIQRIGPLEITGYVDLAPAAQQLRLDIYFRPDGWNATQQLHDHYFQPVWTRVVPLRHPDNGMSVFAQFNSHHLAGHVSCGVVQAITITGNVPNVQHRLVLNHNFAWASPLDGDAVMTAHSPGQATLLNLVRPTRSV